MNEPTCCICGTTEDVRVAPIMTGDKFGKKPKHPVCGDCMQAWYEGGGTTPEAILRYRNRAPKEAAMSDLLRLYLDPIEIGDDGYPNAWRRGRPSIPGWIGEGGEAIPRIPDLVREQAGHRCIRCHHPFVVGSTPGHWSPCDERCTHGGPIRTSDGQQLSAPSAGEGVTVIDWLVARGSLVLGTIVEAEWRVLTVHHLNGVKHDCRWWNLVSLCQRCHLTIQAKVHMQRPYHREHSTWFKPYVAAFYAFEYLGEELTREETMSRLDELLDLEHRQMELT